MKKIISIASIYLILVCVIRFIFIPEKYIYGHNHEYKFLEFLLIVIIIPAGIALLCIAKSSNTNKSIGIGVMFVISGFAGLLLSTFIEKSIASYQINKDGKFTTGKVDYTYTQRKGSRSSGSIQYHFIVAFNIDNSQYYSLPGYTDEEKYKVGDTITVKYLKRNPFINKIYYKE